MNENDSNEYIPSLNKNLQMYRRKFGDLFAYV